MLHQVWLLEKDFQVTQLHYCLKWRYLKAVGKEYPVLLTEKLEALISHPDGRNWISQSKFISGEHAGRDPALLMRRLIERADGSGRTES